MAVGGALRPKLYVALVLAVALPAALTGFLWPVVGITDCNGTGYRPDTYLALCEGASYGDFEHGAFYFDLEPEAVRNLEAAQILVLGNSRTQVSFSTEATRAFAQRHGWRMYLMGFGFDEGWALSESIIRRYRLKPKAVIINVDPFFTEPQSEVARELLAPGDKSGSYLHYLVKRLAQGVERRTCGADLLPSLTCGRERTIYRSIADGSWDITYYRTATTFPVVIDERHRIDELPRMIATARQFFAATGIDPKCAILTSVPSNLATPLATTELAASIGAPLVLTPMSGLSTFDGSHLVEPSAERWSAQFLADVEPILRRCLSDAVAGD